MVAEFWNHRFLAGGGQARVSDDDPALFDRLRLALLPGVGPRLRQALLDRFGDPTGVFAASAAQLREVPGIGRKLSEAIAQARQEVPVAETLALCRQHRIDLLCDTDDAYPRLLHETHDPPGVLFLRGTLTPADAMAVAIVGTRHATQYGLRIAERLGGGLARAGFTVVSGLARGIDAAAHRGALDAGGRTLAILGSGVLNIYPPEHKQLAEKVAASGAVISEYHPQAAPIRGVFPQRNRIISALSLGVVIVEAALASGALITARHAMEQGREVFAVPGQVDNRMAQGCHRLLRDGARLVESVQDILDELGPLVQPMERPGGETVHHPAELLLNEQEQQVLQAIETASTPIDNVIAKAGLPVHQVLATISVLEMRRLIRRLSGNAVQRL